MTSHPSGIPSLSVSGLFMSVPALCSSAFVKPSPSQSAPPSDGSSGSDPSAPTPVEPAISTRSRAVITLAFFELFIVFSLPIPIFPVSRSHARAESSFEHRIRGSWTIAWSESEGLSANHNNATLSAIPAVTELVIYSPDSSYYSHPISRAFSGNPLFPLVPESDIRYLKGSRRGFRG